MRLTRCGARTIKGVPEFNKSDKSGNFLLDRDAYCGDV